MERGVITNAEFLPLIPGDKNNDSSNSCQYYAFLLNHFEYFTG